MATMIEQHLNKSRKAGSGWMTHDGNYRGPVCYIDTQGHFDNLKKNNPLEVYCRKIHAEGKTYRQAQMEETVALIRENKLGLKGASTN